MSALERFDNPVIPMREDVWAAGSIHSCVHYQLQVDAEPDSLCRILNLFALQFLTPHKMLMNQEDDLLKVEIEIAGLSWHRAELIAQKMRNLICVAEVHLQLARTSG
ncbi:hypothetical protein IIE18_07490 [Pseudomonas sp. V1]|uniref:hypothetical protein n=1 Tax=Pseudomonas arcuscaelestis TaxID=2710591 RepID=UPI00193F24C7|nr:hypothetical protein [Pseudomonas arcuscaelestis]MBM3104973.1 hypothetical protein [Pseudomonas arcuscaelestis]